MQKVHLFDNNIEILTGLVFTLEKKMRFKTECMLDESFYIVHIYTVLTLDEQDFNNTLYNCKYVGK